MKNQSLLEKDVRLHQLLGSLVRSHAVGDELVFKGGTCLIKCFLNYPRFSTDLDFTWLNQQGWADLSDKQARQESRDARYAFLDVLHARAKDHGYLFDPKADVMYGRSGLIMTANFRYTGIQNEPSFIKIQMNFVEPLLFGSDWRQASSLTTGIGSYRAREMRAVNRELANEYGSPLRVRCYRMEEILAEKVRAIFTRDAWKPRDVLDLYLLDRRMGVHVEQHLEAAEKKTVFGIQSRDRYEANFQTAWDRIQKIQKAEFESLLLKPLNYHDFSNYQEQLTPTLEKLHKKIGAHLGQRPS